MEKKSIMFVVIKLRVSAVLENTHAKNSNKISVFSSTNKSWKRKKIVRNDITQGPLVNSYVALIPPFISKLGRARRPLVVATPQPLTQVLVQAIISSVCMEPTPTICSCGS